MPSATIAEMRPADEIPAGMALDILLAEKVLGQDVCRCWKNEIGVSIHGHRSDNTCWSCKHPQPAYFTRSPVGLAGAGNGSIWRLVDSLRQEGFRFEMWDGDEPADREWRALFVKIPAHPFFHAPEFKGHHTERALAIAYAALRAKGLGHVPEALIWRNTHEMRGAAHG